MVKRIFLAFALWCSCVFAEYQVFNYTANIKVPTVNVNTKKSNELSYTLGTERITGYLVTVCCYPCGCSFGEGYPSWLYVVRSKDVSKTLWKMQMVVDGGIFGKAIAPEMCEDFRRRSQTTAQINYIKKANLSWVYMATIADGVATRNKTVNRKSIPFQSGMMGFNVLEGFLIHTGFGRASWKLNRKLAGTTEEFNPYVYSASGTVTGEFIIPSAFAIDPSNYMLNYTTPASGTFSIRFNNKMTEAIRGHADWKDIDRIIYGYIRHQNLVSGSYEVLYEWTDIKDLTLKVIDED